MRVNQDLWHRMGVMESREKVLIRQKAELGIAAQAQQQELGTLQQKVTRLSQELQGWELEEEVADVIQHSLTVSEAPVTSTSVKEVKAFI